MSTIDLESPPALRAQTLRPAVAGAIGNAMEWYDFTVYALFAATIGRQFFPSTDPFSSLIASFAAFAVGFVVRPFGALLFGHIGDRYGRRAALWISVVTMAMPTFAIGLLPTYSQIGIAAPVLLVLMRLLQGLAVAGEMGTSVTFLVEYAQPARRGLIGSASVISGMIGTLAGSAVGAAVTTILSSQALHDWGWRVPFLLGIVLSGAALLLRASLRNEEPVKSVKSPLREAFTTQWRTIVTMLGMNALGCVSFYLCFVFATTYLRQTEHLAAATTLDINTVAMIAALLMIPIAAVLSDWLGRRPVLMVSAAAQLILALPLFWLMHHPSPALALAGQTAFACLVSCFIGISPTVMAEMLPRQVRCTTVSLAYNVGYGVLGGLTPLAALYLMHLERNALSPAYLLMAAAAVSLIVVYFIPETAAPSPCKKAT